MCLPFHQRPDHCQSTHERHTLFTRRQFVVRCDENLIDGISTRKDCVEIYLIKNTHTEQPRCSEIVLQPGYIDAPISTVILYELFLRRFRHHYRLIIIISRQLCSHILPFGPLMPARYFMQSPNTSIYWRCHLCCVKMMKNDQIIGLLWENDYAVINDSAPLSGNSNQPGLLTGLSLEFSEQIAQRLSLIRMFAWHSKQFFTKSFHFFSSNIAYTYNIKYMDFFCLDTYIYAFIARDIHMQFFHSTLFHCSNPSENEFSNNKSN